MAATVSRQEVANLEQAMLDNGAVSVTVEEYIPPGHCEQAILEPSLGETPIWDHVQLTGLFGAEANTAKIQWLIQQRVNSPLQLSWKSLEDKDWERQWMNDYHPIRCSDNFWICPSWQKPPDPAAVNLLLDPGLAFGTGTHATTFLCLQWLIEQNLSGATIIDYGCGSGILGISALLLGAQSAEGIDIDPQALMATRNNVTQNGLDNSRFPVYLPNEIPDDLLQADFLVANILAATLINLAPVITNHLKHGGKLCLSGILPEQAAGVIEAYQPDINFEPIVQNNEWVRLSGFRR